MEEGGRGERDAGVGREEPDAVEERAERNIEERDDQRTDQRQEEERRTRQDTEEDLDLDKELEEMLNAAPIEDNRWDEYLADVNELQDLADLNHPHDLAEINEPQHLTEINEQDLAPYNAPDVLNMDAPLDPEVLPPPGEPHDHAALANSSRRPSRRPRRAHTTVPRLPPPRSPTLAPPPTRPPPHRQGAQHGPHSPGGV